VAEVAIVALGSSRRDRGGAYSINRACRRVVADAERLAARVKPKIVVFSGWSPDGGTSEAEQMHALWRGRDVEVVLETTASTTAENAARALPLLLAHGVEHVMVVCAPLHAYRVRWFFRRLYDAHGIRVTVHPARLMPTPAALAWELGALAVRSRQLRAAREELQRGR
jgi:uncharacterized SAM-binding protein YcdF (DUF218 family)